MTALTATRLRRPSAVAAAALAYPAAWIAGLGVPVPAVDIDASASQVIDALSGHEGAFVVREVLVHGIAGVLLGAVVLAFAGATERAGERRLARGLRIAGLGAAGLSLTQFALGLGFIGGADAELFDAINVVDGVKMLALAGVGGLAVAAGRRTGLLSRAARGIAAAMGATITVSGVGYLLTVPSLGLAAYASLPLLLATIAAMGLAAGRRR